MARSINLPKDSTYLKSIESVRCPCVCWVQKLVHFSEGFAIRFFVGISLNAVHGQYIKFISLFWMSLVQQFTH